MSIYSAQFHLLSLHLLDISLCIVCTARRLRSLWNCLYIPSDTDSFLRDELDGLDLPESDKFGIVTQRNFKTNHRRCRSIMLTQRLLRTLFAFESVPIYHLMTL